MPPNFNPQASPPPPPPPERPNTPPPVPNPLRQDHSMPFGEQHTVDVNNLPKVAGQNLFQGNNPQAPNSEFNFMFETPPPKRTPGLSLFSSSIGKFAAVLGGLIVIIIFIAVLSSAFKGSSNVSYLMSVLEDQEELAHIASNASQETDLSTNYQNFVATTNMAVSSGSTQLQSYLSNNGYKVPTKELTLKESAVTDTDLTAAEASGDYNSAFATVAKEQLSNYQLDLKEAYSKTKGVNGRALLTSQYNQSNLLITSLDNGS